MAGWRVGWRVGGLVGLACWCVGGGGGGARGECERLLFCGAGRAHRDVIVHRMAILCPNGVAGRTHIQLPCIDLGRFTNFGLRVTLAHGMAVLYPSRLRAVSLRLSAPHQSKYQIKTAQFAPCLRLALFSPRRALDRQYPRLGGGTPNTRTRRLREERSEEVR